MLLVVPAAALLLAGGTKGEAAIDPGAKSGASTELIVGLAAGVSDAEGEQLLAAAGVQGGRKLPHVAAKLVRVDPARQDAVFDASAAIPASGSRSPITRCTPWRCPATPPSVSSGAS